MRFQRAMMSGSVWLSAWPMCSEPVTFGGGMTMLNRGLSDSGLARNAPLDSQNAYQRGSTSACSKALESSRIDPLMLAGFGSQDSGVRDEGRGTTEGGTRDGEVGK